jgi:hypothetical protein
MGDGRWEMGVRSKELAIESIELGERIGSSQEK